MNKYALAFPEPLEFLEFLGAEPVESRPEDGYWCYEFGDRRAVCLRFSFSATERSVQTALSLDGAVISVCSHEGATRVSLQKENKGKTIRALFRYGTADAELVAHVEPSISVAWSALVKREG